MYRKRKMQTKALSLIMVPVMLLVMLSIGRLSELTAHAATIRPVTTWNELTSAVASSSSGDIIEVMNDIENISTACSFNGKNITIRSSVNGPYTLKMSNSAYSNTRHFSMTGYSDTALTLENIILDGSERAGGVQVGSSDYTGASRMTLTMNSGAVIQNCVNGRYTGVGDGGGGVCVYGVTSTLNMLDGSAIQNCSGPSAGGVFSKGTLNMYDGAVIEGCANIDGEGETSYGGGVHSFGANATFNMSGGVIRGNTALAGAGVAVSGGKFFMSGGVIGGDDPTDGNVTDKGTIGSSSSETGGGVYARYFSSSTPTFEMSGDSKISNNKASSGGGVYVNEGTFEMSGNSTICNNTSIGADGGGVYASGDDSIFTMDDNSTIRDNTASGSMSSGGGVFITDIIFTMNGNSSISGNRAAFRTGGARVNDSTFIMNDDSSIADNEAPYSGGVYVNQFSSFTMNGNSSITGNTATAPTGDAGGVLVIYASSFTMNDHSLVSGNTAGNSGGGVYVTNRNGDPISKFVMNGGTVSNNTANGTGGGGIYLDNTTPGSETEVTILNDSKITGNKAPNGDGGGIYTEFTTTYEKPTIASTVTFSGNTASKACVPPADASTLYPNIEFASVSIVTNPLHPLNNYDINYAGTEIFRIIYDANGGTGGYESFVENGQNVDVLTLDDTGITHPDSSYKFTGWNTQADGQGISYEPGDSILISGDVTLYAQWEKMCTVSFESNGGGSVADQTKPYGGKAEKPADPVKEGYIFKGWYTDDGTFENAWDYNTEVTEDITLYAKWEPVAVTPEEPEKPEPEKPEPDIAPTGDRSAGLYVLFIFSLALTTFLALHRKRLQTGKRRGIYL